MIRLLVFLPINGSAQFFEDLNTDFPMDHAEEIFQDEDGFLWIGTVNGLIRFDGYRTVLYAHDPMDSTSISANNINGIGQDHLGRIWVGLNAYGLNLLDHNFRRFEPICIPDTAGTCQENISVNDFASDAQQQMWVGTSRGLYLFDTRENPILLQSYHSDSTDLHSLSGDHILHTYIDHRHRLWIGTTKGINLFDAASGTFIHHHINSTFPDAPIVGITEDRTGKIYVSTRFTEQALFTFDENSGHFIPAPGFTRKMGELRITFDFGNTMWVSSRGMGAFKMHAATNEQTFFDPLQSRHHGFRNMTGLEPLCDRYGNIWITGVHLMKLPSTGKAITRIVADEGPVNCVFAQQQNVWFSELEFRRFDPTNAQAFAVFPPGFSVSHPLPEEGGSRNQKIYAIRDFTPTEILMTSTRSVWILNKQTHAFREYPAPYGGPFRDFEFTADRKYIWICGNQGAPILFSLTTGQFSRPAYANLIHNPRCVIRSDRGDLWFGTGTNGVYRMHAETNFIENYYPVHPIPSSRLSDYLVHDLAITGDSLWVATSLGVNMIDVRTGHVRQLRKQKNFEHESVQSIVADQRGHVWMGTRQGLVMYDPRSDCFYAYTRHDGLINTVYAERAGFRDDHGLLYFGGDRGIDIIDPGQMGFNPIPPDLFLSGISVNNVPLDTAIAAHHLQSLELEHSQNFIEIELLALHLTAPGANQYAYRIPELDTAWRELGTRRTITLANMRPGAYSLEARAANADGVWSDIRKLIDIRIRPPFWATWWFLILIGAASLAIAALLYRSRIRQIKIRERIKADFSRRIVELESKALRAQMNPHFLFNSINSVKSLISQEENAKATQYLTRFSQLIRLILDNSEKPFVRLQEELAALQLYLEIEQLRFQNFNFRIEVGPDVNDDFIEVPPLILQPYVENAIWHGLMHKPSGERHLSIRISRDSDDLVMTLEDNGIGRARAMELKTSGSTRKGGMGMRLTQDRLNLLQQHYGWNVRVYIHDLMDNQKASGTRVEIRIPYPE